VGRREWPVTVVLIGLSQFYEPNDGLISLVGKTVIIVLMTSSTILFVRSCLCLTVTVFVVVE